AGVAGARGYSSRARRGGGGRGGCGGDVVSGDVDGIGGGEGQGDGGGGGVGDAGVDGERAGGGGGIGGLGHRAGGDTSGSIAGVVRGAQTIEAGGAIGEAGVGEAGLAA